MAKIAELQVKLLGTENVGKSASAICDCLESCRDAFAKLADEMAVISEKKPDEEQDE